MFVVVKKRTMEFIEVRKIELLRKEKFHIVKVTYLRFIKNFSMIVKPITPLTERDQKYEWGAERKEAFQTLKNNFETSKVENTPVEMLRDLDQQIEKRGQIMVPLVGSEMDEAHASRRSRIVYHSSIRCAPFEALYGMKYKVVLIKEKLKDRQKSYADNRRKQLKFVVGDRVMLKVSPWKGVILFGKKGKLTPRYVGPFEILERISPVAYRLRLPEELSGVHYYNI
ncbi:hypothetical protein Tco_0965616 [Tanacetum coccineum]